jgi:hypothetical protein
MREFYTPHKRRNHLNIDASHVDVERLFFNVRFERAKWRVVNRQTVAKSYILDNKITFKESIK